MIYPFIFVGTGVTFIVNLFFLETKLTNLGWRHKLRLKPKERQAVISIRYDFTPWKDEGYSKKTKPWKQQNYQDSRKFNMNILSKFDFKADGIHTIA